MTEKNVKKMTLEEILETEAKVETLGNQIEVSTLQLGQFKKMLKNGSFERSAEVDINNLTTELERQKQNLSVFKKQAKTGVFQTI